MNLTKKIEQLSVSAEEWDLFTGNPDTETRVNEAANALTDAFVSAVNRGLDRSAVSREVEKVMERYSDTGARDTEPRRKLDQLLEMVLG